MKVITLGSGRGGTGKSVLAANLGLALARRGVRTCLVDLDLACADLHLMLGLPHPRRGIVDVLRGGSPALADVAVPAEPAGLLTLVPGADESRSTRGLSTRDIGQLTAGLADLPADVVLVDLPAGAGHQTLDLFLAADMQLVVAGLDPLSLGDAGRLLALARLRAAAHGNTDAAPHRPRVYTSLDELVEDMSALKDERPAQRRRYFRPALVLNRVQPGGATIARDEAKRLGRELGGLDLPVLAEIPDDPAVERSVLLLQPLLQLAHGSPAARAIDRLAGALADDRGIDLLDAVETAHYEAAAR